MRLLYTHAVLIDTSAVVALKDTSDNYHQDAVAFFDNQRTAFKWYCLNSTSHETYTTMRYSKSRTMKTALEGYDFLRPNDNTISCLIFDSNDERSARDLLQRYSDQDLSYHDALCAIIMKKFGILSVFTFDSHFYTLGFEIVPGMTKR